MILVIQLQYYFYALAYYMCMATEFLQTLHPQQLRQQTGTSRMLAPRYVMLEASTIYMYYIHFYGLGGGYSPLVLTHPSAIGKFLREIIVHKGWQALIIYEEFLVSASQQLPSITSLPKDISLNKQLTFIKLLKSYQIVNEKRRCRDG